MFESLVDALNVGLIAGIIAVIAMIILFVLFVIVSAPIYAIAENTRQKRAAEYRKGKTHYVDVHNLPPLKVKGK